MFYDAFELAPGEVAADRYDPADEASPVTTPADVTDAEWDANPWF